MKARELTEPIMNKDPREKAAGVNYHDVSFFLMLIPCINALNYYLTYSHIRFNWHTLVTFTVDTLQGYAAWLVIRAIILWLDKRMTFTPQPLKRILAQVIFTSVAGLAVIVISTEILNWIVKGEPMPPSFYRFDIFIFLIWFFVTNGIYVALFYYYRLRESESLRQREKAIRQNGFIVKQGRQNLQISFDETAAFYVEGEYSMMITIPGKKHLLDLSLDKVEKTLPGELFFRLNRQLILHRSRIKGYEKGENGKINIMAEATGNLPESISVSRTRAPSFKTWFDGSK